MPWGRRQGRRNREAQEREGGRPGPHRGPAPDSAADTEVLRPGTLVPATSVASKRGQSGPRLAQWPPEQLPLPSSRDTRPQPPCTCFPPAPCASWAVWHGDHARTPRTSSVPAQPPSQGAHVALSPGGPCSSACPAATMSASDPQQTQAPTRKCWKWCVGTRTGKGAAPSLFGAHHWRLICKGVIHLLLPDHVHSW